MTENENRNRDIRDITIPPRVAQILNALGAAGFEAYAVGGCVRDLLLGREPADWDITTAARPEQVKALFRKTIDTGIKHGTVTVRLGGENYEVTTYRVDGAYTDHRHPESVTFTPDLADDLRRRDFTVNAMALGADGAIVDLFGGREDLENQIIRCVGSARERFEEDALRILRAFRFSAQLGFTVEEETRKAAAALAPSLAYVSAERIQAELVKLITSPHPEVLREAWQAGVTAVILPEFDAMMNCEQNNAHHIYTVGEHTIRTMMACPPDRLLRLTMLCHDMGKPQVRTLDENGIFHYRGHAAASADVTVKLLRRLRFDRATERQSVALVRNHSLYPPLTDEGVRRAVVTIGEELFPAFLEVKQADIRGQNPEVWEKKLEWLTGVRKIYERILARGDCLSLKDLAVNGNDLQRAGVASGVQIGRTLAELFDLVLADPTLNRRDILLERAEEM